jgi:hypothetical protein
LELLERYSGNYLSVNRFKPGRVLTVGSVFEGVEMGLEVDAIINRILFEEENTGLVELAIEWEDEGNTRLYLPVALRRI